MWQQVSGGTRETFEMIPAYTSEIKGKDSKACNVFKKDGNVKESHCTDIRKIICGSE